MRQSGALLVKILLSVSSALMCTALAGAQVAVPPSAQEPLSLVLGQPRSLQVAKAYGMVTDSLPIIVPPGRRGMELT